MAFHHCYTTPTTTRRHTAERRQLRNQLSRLCQSAVVAGLLFSSVPSYACVVGILQSTPDHVFIKHADGTVTDTRTGLMWMRCHKGENWSGEYCLGVPQRFDWPRIIADSGRERTGGYTDWRLPNKNELASIMEVTCSVPAFNTRIFSNGYILKNLTTIPMWTATRGPDNDIDKMWIVDFYNGDISLKPPLTVHGYARYVRSAN